MMMCMETCWKILIASAWLCVVFGLPENDKIYHRCDIGQHLNHTDRTGQVRLLVCTEKIEGISQWEFADGTSTLGEIFNPAQDCPDIVDRLPEAEDGFYWIILPKGTKHKIWCDVHTDRGGFALVGMQDSPESWTVPSNPTPVHPQGPPHWSSDLGDLKVLDFRVQVSTEKTFEGTKADWFYRVKPQRELGNLFSLGNGCPHLKAGIGNISFVKDIMTDAVVTTNFTCSKFGPHTDRHLGWGKMNYCLRNPCYNGYAILYPVKFRYDNFGSYSYSAVSQCSGMNHNATAFVGCDNHKCCACFGPKGGRQNYCGSMCNAINGGTVTTKAFVWFWVRNRMPKRPLWNKCMEFVLKNSADKLEKHLIDPQTGIAFKGSCSAEANSYLNEGTLTVPDKENFEEIPNVPGLIAYRADNKKLYVNEGSKWQALCSEQELRQLKKQVQTQEDETNIQEMKLQNQAAEIESQKTKFQNHEARIQNQETKFLSQGTQIRNQETEIRDQGTKIGSQEERLGKQETKIQNQETKIQNLETEMVKQKTKIQNRQTKIRSQGLKIQNHERRIQNQESYIRIQAAKIQSQGTKIQKQETKIQNHETEIQKQKTEIQNQETKIEKQQTKIEGQETKIERQEVETQKQKTKIENLKTKIENQETKTQNQETKIQSQGMNIEKQETEIQIQKAKIQNQETEIQKQKTKLQNQETRIQNQGTKIQSQGTNLQNQETEIRKQKAKIEIQQTEIQNEKAKLQNQETRIQNQDTRIESQGRKLQNQETEIQKQKAKIEIQETEIQNQKAKLQNQETRIQNQDTRIESQGTKLQNQETEIQRQKTKIQNQQTEIQNQKAKFQNQETKFQSQETEIQNQKTKIQSQQTEIQNQKAKLQNQETEIQSQKRKIQEQETAIQNQETKTQRQETRLQSQESKIRSQENMIEVLQKQIQDIMNRTEKLYPLVSCAALLAKHPSTTSGMYYINPRALSFSPSVQVYCDMTSKNGVGVTVIGHDSESRTIVDGYDPPGSYKRKIKYDISMEQIVAIIKQSKNCEQLIKYECYHSMLLKKPHGWWVSRQGSQMNYWGGAAVNSGKCACGMTNSCDGGGICNCDANGKTWREDSGYLTDMNTLPVTELKFGDTGTYTGGIDEKGFHTLGKLRCWN